MSSSCRQARMQFRALLFIILSFSAQVLAADCGPLGAAPGEYLVRWKSTPNPQLFSTKTSSAFTVKRWIYKSEPTSTFSKIFSQIETPVAPLSLHENLRDSDVNELKEDANVLSVEPNCYRDVNFKPNDSMYRYQWGMLNIDAESAWDRSVGTTKIIVAVSDTGVDYTHEDLRDQMWVNAAEQNGRPGVDDDGNGCIDDIYGCDTGNNDGNPMPSNDTISFHGTHVAGIIGAKPNNSVGIAGVAWNVKIMAAKGFSDVQSSSTMAGLLASVYYSANNGARIINCSWGGAGTPSQAERDAIRYARNRGILVILAAGNDGANVANYTPASISEAITVGSINSQSNYSHFSNYGPVLDLLAPGGEMINGSMSDPIYSTMPGNNYGPQVGTSMAAPFVSGVAALVLSVNSSLSLSQLENILLQSATVKVLTHPNNPGQSYTHRLVNAKRAVEMALATLPLEIDPNECNEANGENCTLDLPSIDASNNPGQGKMAGCGQVSSGSHFPSGLNGALLLLIFSFPLICIQFFFQRSN